MANINDYLMWRGDIPLSKEYPFNEIDNMVLARFSYLIFERMDLMKKLFSLAAAVSMLTNMPFTFVKAEDSAAVPVKLDKAVYDQLIEY